jgi:hypothetical protein
MFKHDPNLPRDALQVGLEEKAKEFKASGAEVYARE